MDNRYATTYDMMRDLGLCNCDRAEDWHEYDVSLCNPAKRFRLRQARR